tara:strand:+ start:599 stop:706 length:108 start_codon:yes stop_codon:yes gene_type:complete
MNEKVTVEIKSNSKDVEININDLHKGLTYKKSFGG